MLEELAVPAFCAIFFGGLGVYFGWQYRGAWEKCDKPSESDAQVGLAFIQAKALCYDHICKTLGVSGDVIGHIKTHYTKNSETADAPKIEEAEQSVEDPQGSEK